MKSQVETLAFTISDLLHLERFALKLAAQLKPPLSVALVGGLGSGKTTFLRLMAKAWSLDSPVTSPTFVLEHRYTCTADSPSLQSLHWDIRHWDFYRLAAVPEELWEPLSQQELRFLEWADKFPNLLEDCDLCIALSLPDLNQPGLRHLEISGSASFRLKALT